jgi:PAS domain S-box-containing protein
MKARSPGATAVQALYDPVDILEQLQMAVVVTDRDGNLVYANSFAASLLGFPDDPAHLVGRSLVSLGIEEGDARRVNDLVTQVLHGREWEGTFASQHMDGSRVFIRARGPAAPAVRRDQRHRHHGR